MDIPILAQSMNQRIIREIRERKKTEHGHCRVQSVQLFEKSPIHPSPHDCVEFV